jgi:hypothetical protein
MCKQNAFHSIRSGLAWYTTILIWNVYHCVQIQSSGRDGESESIYCAQVPPSASSLNSWSVFVCVRTIVGEEAPAGKLRHRINTKTYESHVLY